MAFLNALRSHFDDPYLDFEDALPLTTQIHTFRYNDPVSGQRHWNVGSGVGIGVERAVLREVMSIITDNGLYWKHDTTPGPCVYRESLLMMSASPWPR